MLSQDVTKLLQSAGMAIKALTNQPSTDEGWNESSIEKRKSLFTETTSQYFSLLSTIDVNLRRQIYALEEADIIPAEIAAKESQTSPTVPAALAALSGPRQNGKEKAPVHASGMGNLDVGWLNSRNDGVGKEMEAELWAKAHDLVEGYAREGVETKTLEADVDMVDDEASVVPAPSDSLQ